MPLIESDTAVGQHVYVAEWTTGGDTMSDSRTLRFVPELEERTVRRVVGVFVALAGLLVVLGLVAVLPGIDRLVAGLAVSPAAVLLAVATLLVVAALLRVAPTVERVVFQTVDGPAQAVTDAAASAKLLVGFAAVVVAYRGFGPAATPLFETFGIGGLYHLGFLAVGLLVLGAFVRRFYRCWEPVTDLLTARVADALGGRAGNRVSTDR